MASKLYIIWIWLCPWTQTQKIWAKLLQYIVSYKKKSETFVFLHVIHSFKKKMLLTVTSMRGKDTTVVIHLSNMLRSDPLKLVRMSKKIFECGWELALHGRVTFKFNIQAHHKKKWQSFNHSWAAICTFFNSDSWLLGLTGSQPKNQMNVIETSILFAI